MAMTTEERLGRESISKLLLQFSIPAIAAVMTHGLYNVVDRFFVGRYVGAGALAAVQISFPLMLIQFGLFALICGGATALISIRLGENRHEDANKIFANGLFMVVIIGLLLSAAVLPNIANILHIFATSENLFPYASSYLGIIFMGSPIFALTNYFAFTARGEGNVKRAMQILILAATSNIVLDIIFIAGLGMGVKGAAIATVCSSVLGMLWGIQYFSGKQRILIFSYKNLIPKFTIAQSIVALGFSSCIGTFATGIQSGMFIRQIQVYGGDTAAASAAIMFAVASIFIMPNFGLSDAVQPIVGFNWGAGKLRRVRQTLTLALIIAIAYGLFSTVILEVFAGTIAGVFTPAHDIELQKMATHAVRLSSWALPLTAIQIIVPRYLQAIGKALEATILGLTRQILFFIPLILILPAMLGTDGAWLTIAIADCGAGIICGIRVFGVIKRRNKQGGEEA